MVGWNGNRSLGHPHEMLCGPPVRLLQRVNYRAFTHFEQCDTAMQFQRFSICSVVIRFLPPILAYP